MAIDGVTVMLVPLPADVPPQVPVYHCQLVALFKEPDAMLNVVLLPIHNGLVDAEIDGNVGRTQGAVTVCVRVVEVDAANEAFPTKLALTLCKPGIGLVNIILATPMLFVTAEKF